MNIAIVGTGQVCREIQPPITYITLHQFFQPRFINRHLTNFQFVYFICVYIHASHSGTHFCKTSTGHQANIACAYNCYIHILLLLSTYFILPSLCVLHSRNHSHNAYHSHSICHIYRNRSNNHISSFGDQDH